MRKEKMDEKNIELNKENRIKDNGKIKERIKRAFKYLLPAYLIAFVSIFMLFVYEPINMYATNTDDFWFDLYIMLKPTLLLALILFGILILFYTIVYIVNNLISKKLYVYKTIVIISLIVFIGLYIQGNFLISNLPHLDGTKIIWDDYTKITIISTGILLLMTIIVTFFTIKFKYDKTIKIYSFITGTIFVMLTVSLVSTLFSTNALKRKYSTVISTSSYINNASKNKNFFIFVLDAIDSVECEKVLRTSEYKDAFNDFTYFPDTISAYPFTRDSVPFILSGIWNENEKEFAEYNNEALDNSPLLNTLDKEGYDLNIFNCDFSWSGKNAIKLKNGKELDRKMNNEIYLKQLTKYVAFKYLPFELKKFSKIETMDFNKCKEDNGKLTMGWLNRWYYNMVTGGDIVKQDRNYFSYTHIEGGHVPYWCDKDFNEIEDGTYDDAIGGSLHVFNAFIQRLKDNGVYDNSVIILMSDHGFNCVHNVHYGRQNPIFFVKGINEHHDNMITSDKPVSFEDLNEIYTELLDGKTSEELLPNIDYNRKRRYLLYAYGEEDHMVEYEQTGKAWDTEAMVETGRVFDLKK